MTNHSSTSGFDVILETFTLTIPTNIPTILTNNQPSPSNLAIQPITPPKPTKIPSPPTMYQDLSLLADVCENIFHELNRLIQSRNDLIHHNSYEQSWKRLKKRVENVLNALQRTCMDDQDIAQQKLKDWLKGVTSNLQEVRILRTWVQNPLCLRQRNETNFIPAGIHPRELNVNWLTRMNIKPISTESAVLQRNAELENENRKLKKELLKQKLLLIEYKSSTEAKLKEARVREEKLIESNGDFKREMKQQAEETNKMMKQVMEMFQKQVQP